MRFGNYDGFNKGGDYGCYYKTREEWEQTKSSETWSCLHRYYDERTDGPFQHTTYKLYHPDKHTVEYRLNGEARKAMGYVPCYHFNVIYETETRYEVMARAKTGSRLHTFLIEHGFEEF